MPRHFERVLFTGGRSPATLALLRLFAKRGSRCYVAESQPINLTGVSRFCQKNLRMPPPHHDPEAYIHQLEKWIQTHHIQILIPTCGEIFYISRWKHRLEQSCEVFTSSIDILTNLYSKYQLAQILQGLKLKISETQRVENPQPIAQALKHIQPSPGEPWVVQRFLDGPRYCSYSIARSGQLKAHSVYLSAYCTQGFPIYFETVNIPTIQRTVEKIVAALHYSGQIAFDFIFNQGHYWLIGYNPCTPLGAALYVPEDDLPTAFTPDYQGPIVYPRGERNRMITLAMLAYTLRHIRSWETLQEVLHKMHNADDIIFQLDDLQPFLKQFHILWNTWRTAQKHRINLIKAWNMDIEWNHSYPLNKIYENSDAANT